MRRALNVRLAWQAAAIKTSANVVVQLLALWRHQSHPQSAFAFDPQQVAEFAFYGAFNSQLSNLIQFLLEDWFPTHPGGLEPDDSRIHHHPSNGDDVDLRQLEEKRDDAAESDGRSRTFSAVTADDSRWRRWERRLHLSPDVIWRNVFAKMLLDQTLGLFISGCIFLFVTNVFRSPDWASLFAVIRERVFALIKAGWHIWPLVALANFLWVPVRSRVLVAVFVGFGWSIFLSVFAMQK